VRRRPPSSFSYDCLQVDSTSVMFSLISSITIVSTHFGFPSCLPFKLSPHLFCVVHHALLVLRQSSLYCVFAPFALTFARTVSLSYPYAIVRSLLSLVPMMSCIRCIIVCSFDPLCMCPLFKETFQPPLFLLLLPMQCVFA